MKTPILTIAIPTYNRIKFLTDKLDFLINNYNPLFEVLVIQNNSDKDKLISINEYIEYQYIKIINNEKNIGANLNIIKCIELSNTKWVWVLGDDDEINKDSIKNILFDLDNNKKDLLCINYSTSIHTHKRETILNNLKHFFINLNNYKTSCSNILFISANIFNVNEFKKNIYFGVNFSNSFAPHLAILFAATINSNKKTLLSKKKIIISHDNDENLKWSRYAFAISIVKLLDLEFFKKQEMKKYLKKFISNIVSSPLNSYFLSYNSGINKTERKQNNYKLYKVYLEINNNFLLIHIIFILNSFFLSFDIFNKILNKLKTKYKKRLGK